MAIRKVLRMGDSLLLKKAQPVREFNTPALHQILDDLRDTMKAREGVGLAAPQIGESLQIIIFGMQYSSRYPHAQSIPETILINPRIEFLGNRQEKGWEGCLSLPDMRGAVSRYQHILYSGQKSNGQYFSREVTDFHARVVQHEYDHLQGILYPMRLDDLSQWGFSDEIMETVQ